MYRARSQSKRIPDLPPESQTINEIVSNPFVHYLKKRRKGEAHEKYYDSKRTVHSPTMTQSEQASDIFEDGQNWLFNGERPVAPMLRNQEVKTDAASEDTYDVEHVFPAVRI